ncbi:MAG: agmatine deiminase family protein, partial [Marinilabiliaceae bacterium]|nr:agmatine deiminase family protein [Marinilabiliaceae bacterium]
MRVFPAEWEPQSGVQLTWPDSCTDWSDILEEVIPVYQLVAK